MIILRAFFFLLLLLFSTVIIGLLKIVVTLAVNIFLGRMKRNFFQNFTRNATENREHGQAKYGGTSSEEAKKIQEKLVPCTACSA